MRRQDDREPVHLVCQGTQVWARSVCGRLRGENQDAWSVVTPERSVWGPAAGQDEGPGRTGRVREGVVAAVFDGLGGHPNGRAAARQAARRLIEIADGRLLRADLLGALDRSVRDTGGATTAVVAFLGRSGQGPRLRVVSVGDSAAYVLNGAGRLERVNELDRAGRHELTDCLGAGDGVGHEVESVNGAGVVLASDGVGDVLPDLGEWGSLLLAGPAQVATEMDRLFKAVEQAGAPDNATLVVARG